MPELPEVETNIRALRPHLTGRRIDRVDVHTDKLRHPVSPGSFDAIEGRSILGFRRWAKYIIVDLDGPVSLSVHLGMTGAFRICPADVRRAKHEHIIIYLDNGLTWRYIDQRKFGIFRTWQNTQGIWPSHLPTLGPEPLDDTFSGSYLKEISLGRTAPVKTFILDQRVVVGVGNIYASEALFRARINPKRNAGRISLQKYELLTREIKSVLKEAIEMGGTTIADFRTPDGSEGRFRINLKVYGRQGKICPACNTKKVIRIVQTGRSTFYCPGCQK